MSAIRTREEKNGVKEGGRGPRTGEKGARASTAFAWGPKTPAPGR